LSNARAQIHLGLSPRQDDVVSRHQFDFYHYEQGSRPFLSPDSGGLYAARKGARRGIKRRFMPHREIYKRLLVTIQYAIIQICSLFHPAAVFAPHAYSSSPAFIQQVSFGRIESFESRSKLSGLCSAEGCRSGSGIALTNCLSAVFDHHDNYPLLKWFFIKHGQSRSAPRPVSDAMHRIDSSTSSAVPRQIA
jgi:hypothetical protein